MSIPQGALVLGSCVSRDLFEELPRGRFRLVDYVARQSLISSFSKPVNAIEMPAVASAFQQRMVEGDFTSSLPLVLERTADKVDLVLWDLTDERLGIYLLQDDTVITRSVDLIASGAEGGIASTSMFIQFGDDAHFEMWSQSLLQFQQALEQHHPRAQIVLLALPWAELTESGRPTPTSFGLSASEANSLYSRYFDAAQKLATETLGRSDPYVRAADDHRWGTAPFHYAHDPDILRALTILSQGGEQTGSTVSGSTNR